MDCGEIIDHNIINQLNQTVITIKYLTILSIYKVFNSTQRSQSEFAAVSAESTRNKSTPLQRLS